MKDSRSDFTQVTSAIWIFKSTARADLCSQNGSKTAARGALTAHRDLITGGQHHIFKLKILTPKPETLTTTRSKPETGARTSRAASSHSNVRFSEGADATLNLETRSRKPQTLTTKKPEPQTAARPLRELVSQRTVAFSEKDNTTS